ncbi:MAG: hypothetical protein R3F01_07980 [Lysobacteraceae bacterium]
MSVIRRLGVVLLAAGALAAAPSIHAQAAPPTFSKAFLPDTIGPGSASLLRFEIVNGAPTPVTDLAFTDTLPAGVTLATPAHPTTTCTGGLIAAPDGGSTVSFSNGSIGGNASCFVDVLVTSSTPGTHMNVSGDLTSSAGNSGTATDDLDVATDRPAFSKAFSPSTIQAGGRSTLTFTLDNSLNAAPESSIAFTDTFPAGLQIASPSNVSTDCPGTLTATANSSTITLLGSFLLANTTCTVVVDVTATGAGQHDNISGDLTSTSGGPVAPSGRAVATLMANADTLHLTKTFIDDPVAPGNTVTLRFSLLNADRNEPASNISFTDDLGATLSGLVATGLPLSNPCGPGSQLSGTSLLTLTGGNLPAEGSCEFDVTLQVPAGAVAGGYPNTTSQVSADQFGSAQSYAAASDTLFVSDAPGITKTFLTNPVGAGDTVTLEFTIQNSSSTSSATDIAFMDNLTQFMSGVMVTALPAPGFCGAGSGMFVASISGDDQMGMSGGNLGAGGSCTFSVDLLIANGIAPGDYLNRTTAITATVDGSTQTGNSAEDSLTVVSPPELRKDFIDDPVLPGNPVTLRFTIDNTANGALDATAIAFTDDLDATMTGSVATGLPLNDVCGTGSQISGTSTLSFSGGTLAAGSSCSFDVTVQVPAAGLPGNYINTTSALTADVSGIATTGTAASDTLIVSGLSLSKQFADDLVLPGNTVTLEFTIDNTQASTDATGMFFTDNLSSMLSGAAAVAPLPATPCGAGSSISGTTSLIFTGGDLTAGTSCTFSITVQVPAAAANGDYANITSSLTAVIGGIPVTLPPAQDVLSVNDNLLLLQKAFTDDPVMPGDTVTLEFTLSNQDASNAITGIAFTDDLDAALSGLVATGLPANGVCGAGSQIAGTSLLTLTGGNLGAGASCTFSVTLQVPGGAAPGDFVNTTSSAAGDVGGIGVTGDPASDTLRVRVVDFSKSFDGPSTAGGTAVLTFTIDNINAVAAANGLAFTDDLDAVLPGLVAVGLPISDVCGAASQISGTSFLTFAGGNLGPDESCSFDVTVQVPAAAVAGTYPNATSDLTSNGSLVGTLAMADLVIEPPPSFAKTFAPASVGVGQPSTLTFTIDNTASALAANALAFTDNLPAGMTVATAPNASTACTGGTITATAGSASISYSGGAVGAGSSCTLSVDVVASAGGALVNTSGDLTSTSGNSGTASDTLTVIPQPGFAKVFAPDVIAANGVSTLTFSIDNSASSVALTGLAFSDNLPAGMTVATPANVSTTCTGGTITATAGSGTIQYSGGSVAAATTCTLSADVTAATPGSYANSSSALTSNIGTAGVANDTLTVLQAALFSKSFAPATVALGATSTLSFSIDNSANAVDASGLDFTDNLPAGMVVATPANASTTCIGGTLTANAGAMTVSYSGGTASAGTSCSVQVDVQVQAAGTLNNTSGDLTSSVGNSGSASASLTVSGGDIAISKVFQSAQVLRGGQIVLRYTIDNLSPSAVVDGVAFSDDLGAVVPGWVAEGLPLADACGAGSSVSGTSVVSLSSGTIAAGGSCSFDVTLQLPGNAAMGTVTSTTSAVTGNAFGNPITGNTATDAFDVVWLGFSKAFVFSGAPIPGSDIGLMFTISNPDPVNAVDGIGFTDDLDAAVPGMFANGLPMSGVCGAGSQISGSGVVTLSNGSIAAGGNCSFQISVHIPNNITAGTYTNNTSPLTATPAGGVASSGDPADIASASIGLPDGVPAAIAAPQLIPTLDPRWLLAMAAMFLMIVAVRLRPNG